MNTSTSTIAEPRVRTLDSQWHEKLPEPAVGDVQIREHQPGHGRRQRERQIDERIEEPLAGKLVTNEHPGDE